MSRVRHFLTEDLARKHIEALTTRVDNVLDKLCINPSVLARAVPLDLGSDVGAGSISEPNDSLSRLPLELIHATLEHVDIAALAALRATSKTLRSAVMSQKQFSDLVQYAPVLLRALQASGAATLLSLAEAHGRVFSALGDTTLLRCNGNPGCQNAAPLLHLPSATRVCLWCSVHTPSLETTPASTLREKLLLDLTTASAVTPLPLGSLPEDLSHPVIHLPTWNAVRAARGEHTIRLDWTHGVDPGRLSGDVRTLDCISFRGWSAASGKKALRVSLSVRVPAFKKMPGQDPTERVVRLCQACLNRVKFTAISDSPEMRAAQASFADERTVAHLTQCRHANDMYRELAAGFAELRGTEGTPDVDGEMVHAQVQYEHAE